MSPSSPYSSELDRPQNNQIQPPLRPPPVVYPSPSAPAFIWFVVVFNRRLVAAFSHDEFRFIYFFAKKIDGRNDMTRSSPIAIVLRAIPPNYIPSLWPTFGWLLCPPIQWKPLKPKAPLLSRFLFFARSICRPKQRVNVLTTRSNPAASPLQRPPPPPPPTYGWLLYYPIKWQPPKAGAPPIFHFFDGCHFGSPINGTTRSEHEPGHPAPAADSY
jgi:hypothetical protein